MKLEQNTFYRFFFPSTVGFRSSSFKDKVAQGPTVRKKKTAKVFCSNFMSFYPMELIFIGWIGDIWEFYWALRNFEFKPTNGIFSQKGEFPFFQKVPFLGVWCRKLSLNKIGVMDMSYIIENKSNRSKTTFPNIFTLISADPADLSKNQKNHFSKKSRFFHRKCALEGWNLVQ